MPGELKQATFDNMHVGEKLGPLTVVADDFFVKKHSFAVDDHNPWYFSANNPFGRRVLTPASLLPTLLTLLNTRYDPDSEVGLHQKEEAWFYSPIEIGETILLTGEFVEKYVKRGRGHIVTDAVAHSAVDGRLIVRHRATEIPEPHVEVQGDPPGTSETRRVAGVMPSGVEPVGVLSGATPLGTPVCGPAKTVWQEQMSVFSNVGSFWRTIHTDLQSAIAAGFETTLAQGLMESVYLSEMGSNVFGPTWYSTGWMSTNYVSPVKAGDVLQPMGIVTGRGVGQRASEIELEAWIENQDGIKSAVGWMKGELSQRASK